MTLFFTRGTTFGVGADRDTSIDGLGVNFAGFGYRPVSGINLKSDGGNNSITNSSYGTDPSFGFYGKQKIGEGLKADVYAGMVYERMGGVFEMYDVLSEDRR